VDTRIETSKVSRSGQTEEQIGEKRKWNQKANATQNTANFALQTQRENAQKKWKRKPVSQWSCVATLSKGEDYIIYYTLVKWPGIQGITTKLEQAKTSGMKHKQE
jgi:hypothetical protein